MFYNCKECGKSFDRFQDKANHVRWKCKVKKSFLKDDTLKKLSDKAKELNTKRHGKYIEEEVICSKPNCEEKVKIKYRENKKKEKYFCSRSCANSRGKRSKEVKEKISKSVSTAWGRGDYEGIDRWSNNKYFSSKNERKIVKYFKENFTCDEWKSGGSLKYKDIRIVRDMWSDKLKVCFEYDGIWHFKDIRGQLEDKQKKDALLEEWCKENDYRLIRISEFSFESVEQIKDLIYFNSEKIIKVGNGYK